MIQYRHGFKADAARLAIVLRKELGAELGDVFDPYALAGLYGVEVFRLSEIGCSEAALNHFGVRRPEKFSGALVPDGSGAVMLENDTHPWVRRRSTASHEMAHVVLEHEFAATMVNEKGCRTSRPADEREATWMAGEMLVPTETARRLGVRGVSADEVAEQFDVSIEMATWRLRMGGGLTIRQRQSERR